MSLFNLFKRVEEEPRGKGKADLDSTFFNMKVRQLPPNFAQTLLDLEMRLEFAESYELETVRQLSDLYRVAIEHYVHEDPKKANHFQRKLTSLLSNPQTLSVIEAKPHPSHSAEELEAARKEQQYQQALRNELGSFNAQSTVVVEQIIEGSCKKMEKNHRLIHQQLSEQESRLRSRLENRSRSNSRQQMKSPRP